MHLALKDFQVLFDDNEFSDECIDFISKTNFYYNRPERSDEVMLHVLKLIDSGTLSKTGSQEKWQKGWKENLDNFIASGYDLGELIPKYVHPGQALRLNGDYALSVDDNFELNFFTVLRMWLFNKYLKDYKHIHEFGCGTGYNLVMLAKMFPDKKLHGWEWAPSAVELVKLIGQKHNLKIDGHYFDMFEPEPNVFIKGALLTIGSMEQLGANFENFIYWITQKKPSICINIEPLYEKYDDNNLFDYVAMRFHKQRNYLIGFLPYLQNLEREHKIKILKTTRMHFGSLFHDGWSITVWEPR